MSINSLAFEVKALPDPNSCLCWNHPLNMACNVPGPSGSLGNLPVASADLAQQLSELNIASLGSQRAPSEASSGTPFAGQQQSMSTALPELGGPGLAPMGHAQVLGSLPGEQYPSSPHRWSWCMTSNWPGWKPLFILRCWALPARRAEPLSSEHARHATSRKRCSRWPAWPRRPPRRSAQALGAEDWEQRQVQRMETLRGASATGG